MSERWMHADEVETSPSLVRRLIAAQFPRWASLPIARVQSDGTDNALYRLGEQMVMRLPRTPGAAGRVDKEHEWLPRLGPLLPLDIPTPVARGEAAECYPWRWSVYEWLDGENATIEGLADPNQAATTLAGFITALHRIELPGGPPPGEHNFGRGVPLAMRDARTRERATLSMRCPGALTRAPRRQRGKRPCTPLYGTLHPSGSTAICRRGICSPTRAG